MKLDHCHRASCIQTVESLRRKLAELEREKSEVYRELSALAKSVFKRYFYPRDDDYKSGRVVWEVLEDSIGVATQLDNMMAGLMQDAEQLAEKDAEIERLKYAAENPNFNGRFDNWQAAAGKYRQEASDLTKQLVASQAVNQQLREALGICLKEIESWCDEIGYERFNHPEVNKALALPADTSALEAMIAKAGEVMRERCEAEWKSYVVGENIDDLIRALPGVTLGDFE